MTLALSELELRIDTYMTADPPPPAFCSVRVTHLPSGLTEICKEHRSALKNREAAIRSLTPRVEAWQSGRGN